MNEVISVLVVALLAASGYAAGRMHGQFSYKLGYRFGYRQGYFDGDRATWNRRRRETQAAMAAVSMGIGPGLQPVEFGSRAGESGR